MFSSHGARHTPHRHTRTQLFRSSIRICQRSCCVRADVQPGVCAHHAFIVCVFIPRGTYFRQFFALSPFSTIHWDIAQPVVGRACTFSCSCPSSQRAACTHTSQTFNFAQTTAKVARRATSEPRKVCIASLRAVVCRVCCCFLAAFLSFGPSVPWQATVLLRNTWNVHDLVHNGTSLWRVLSRQVHGVAKHTFSQDAGHREACRMPVGVGTHFVVVENVETQMHGFSQVCLMR